MLLRARELFLASAVACAATASFAQASSAPLPDIRQLMKEVQQHQKQLEKVRESYTYTSMQTAQDLDSKGNVVKVETWENEDFFVNGHVIERRVKKNGKPLDEHDSNKEAERVTKLVQKAEKTSPDQPLEGQTVSITRLLDIMEVGALRRENFRGRPTIVFDFTGRKDAKTHGLVEDASKKIKGTIWVDEADRQVAHLDVVFFDNLKVGGGLVANLQKGSNFKFDQAPVEDGLWLPTGAEANLAARVLLLKNMRQHFTERVYDYKRFKVDAQQQKDAKVSGQKP
jgi:hypothetical protein